MTTASTVDALDAAAARSCHVFQLFLNKNATGQQVLDAAAPLLAGSAAASTSSLPPPKWAQLGADLIASAGDLNTGDYAKLSTDGNHVVDACGTLSTAAKRAGGYTQ